MKIVRFKNTNGKIEYGWIHQEKIGLIQGDPFGEFRRFEASQLLSEVSLLIPCAPSKIIAVSNNYPDHASEMDSELPTYPQIFLKPPSALITNGEPIVLPSQSSRVEHEAELAIVVGKRSRDLKPEQVKDAIFGYTIANDVTARDLQALDRQWLRSKGGLTAFALLVPGSTPILTPPAMPLSAATSTTLYVRWAPPRICFSNQHN